MLVGYGVKWEAYIFQLEARRGDYDDVTFCKLYVYKLFCIENLPFILSLLRDHHSTHTYFSCLTKF